jgi:hypothetical protein
LDAAKREWQRKFSSKPAALAPGGVLWLVLAALTATASVP